MTDNDSGDDRTVIRPNPGGRRATAPPSPGPAQPPSQQPAAPSSPPGRSPEPSPQPTPLTTNAAADLPEPLGAGINPLVDAASNLLSLSAQLGNSMQHNNVAELRERVSQQIKRFESEAKARGVAPEIVLTSRYLLCTALDEAVLSTPWGAESNWSAQSLLSQFHNEVFGGEKFFVILDRMLQEPARYLDALELIYLCLAMGFEGKYRVSARGSNGGLLEVQDNLYRCIRNQRGDIERDLSPHWKGITDRRNALVRYVPLWVVAAIAGVLLLITYSGFRWALESRAAPVESQLNSIAMPQKSSSEAKEL